MDVSRRVWVASWNQAPSPVRALKTGAQMWLSERVKNSPGGESS